MAHPTFFAKPQQVRLGDIAKITKADIADPALGERLIGGVASLRDAGPQQLAFYDNARYADDLAQTRAGACLVGPRFANVVPAPVAVLTSRRPLQAFVEVTRHFYDDALRPASGFGLTGIAVSAVVHFDARLEDEVIVDPLAVIGPSAEIGSGTVIGAGAIIGPGVRIGRDCSIGAGVVVQHAFIGNNVIIHPGCQIGQDGFGFVPAGGRHLKIPQIGRVIIQNDIEIGAGTAIDRGSLRDTVIGEGTKIDNHVQIGHNAWIGRHCIITGQCGLSGSMTIGDYVVLGARAGVINHVNIGSGAQIAATSAVRDDVPENARWGGVPAKPVKQWFREMVAVERLARPAKADTTGRGHAGNGAPDGTDVEQG